MSKKKNTTPQVSFIEDCYRLYEQKMYRVAYRVLNDEGQAEDAVSEAFIRLMKKDVFFEDAKSDDCKRYIIKVIKNVSINIYNKNKREQELIYLSDKEDTYSSKRNGRNYYEESDNTDNIYGINEYASSLYDPASIIGNMALEEYISYLPDKYYDVIDCLIYKNLSVKETAKYLNISEVNVRKRFERAKAMLRNRVKGEDVYEQECYRERNA